MVLDGFLWRKRLPQTIQAVFFMRSHSAGAKPHAREVHGAFLARYNLSAADVPLLEYDPDDLEGSPFSLAVPD